MKSRAIASILATTILASSCTHTVTIRTDPPGGHVYVDGVYRGAAPIAIETEVGLPPSSMDVKVEKPGYETVRRAELRKSNHADYTLWWLALAPLLGAGVYGYIILGRHYDDEYVFPLRNLDAPHPGAQEAP